MHFSEEFNALLHFLLIENNNEILQYCNIGLLLMILHYYRNLCITSRNFNRSLFHKEATVIEDN